MIKTLNPSLEALNHDHVKLMQELKGLENLVRVPEKMEPTDTTYHMVNLRQHLHDHFRFEEEGGYMEELVKNEPNMTKERDKLCAEHKELAATLDGLIADARMGKACEPQFAQAIRDWVGRVRHHEAEENRVFQDAFTLDVTAED